MTRRAAFDLVSPSSMLKPTTEVTPATPSVFATTSSTCFGDDVGAIDGGALGQLDLAEDRALVLRRQEARRQRR